MSALRGALDDTRDRFLRAIAERVPPDTIVEAHVFPPMRQGGIEAGLAIVAARPGSAARAEEGVTTDRAVAVPLLAGLADVVEPDALEEGVSTRELAAARDTDDRVNSGVGSADAFDAAWDRHTVYTARYRLTLKGADRGKWEVEVVAEADAPLVAIDEVVRGVQRRAGELADPERLTGETFRALAASSPS